MGLLARWRKPLTKRTIDAGDCSIGRLLGCQGLEIWVTHKLRSQRNPIGVIAHKKGKFMKLYHSFGSCSTSCHITLEESGLKYEAIEVDWDNPNDPNVALVNRLNPLGTLPILITDDGKQLDQNVAIQTYVADRVPEKKLLPPAGTFERAEAMNWLSFVASDLHKAIGALFGLPGISSDPAIQDAVRKYMVGRANDQLNYLDSKLEGGKYLMGDQFITADAYAFVVLGWTQWLGIPLDPYKNIQAYVARIAARPAVARVMALGQA